MPQIIQISAVEQAEAVSEAAAKDGHYVIGPTHYWNDKNGLVQGYFSTGVIPVCHFWMRSDSSPRDSLEMIRAAEGVIRERVEKEGLPRYTLLACQPTSPFHPLIERHVSMKPIINNITLFGKSLRLLN